MNAPAIALSNSNLSRLDRDRVTLPGYERGGVKTGVVHFGPGAFHRAHQADYFNSLLANDPSWGIAGVSLHSRDVRDALSKQDCLYTLATLDREVTYRVIGSVNRILCADELAAAKLFLSPDLKLITLTVTEKGYCLDADGNLDLNHSDIAADLRSLHAPSSVIGWIVRCLRERVSARLPLPDILSCDNLPCNGERLRRAVIELAARHDPELAKRIEHEARFPNSMVDSITPATDDALRARVEKEAGIIDAWPIQREAFASWVIEDNFSGDAPDLASVGAIITPDVAAHEKAKLRLLNGAHSALAYLGLAKGHETVADAMADAALRSFAEAMMRDEIAPGLAAPRGLDLGDYRRSLLARFANPAIAHRLSQIAWDGSQKLPIRLIATIEENIRAGRPIEMLTTGVAAWMRFIRRQAQRGLPIVDPESERLTAIGKACRDIADYDCGLFAEKPRVIPKALAESAFFQKSLHDAYRFVLSSESRLEMAHE